jgi:hypothetical protein
MIVWMLPGIAPTGKRIECAIVAIVSFRDGKLAHEHIYWDQASVLVQRGLIDASTLPVAGLETARKLADPTLPANQLIERAAPHPKVIWTGRSPERVAEPCPKRQRSPPVRSAKYASSLMFSRPLLGTSDASTWRCV